MLAELTWCTGWYLYTLNLYQCLYFLGGLLLLWWLSFSSSHSSSVLFILNPGNISCSLLTGGGSWLSLPTAGRGSWSLTGGEESWMVKNVL